MDNAPELTTLQLLHAVQYALNMIPNSRLRGCPHGIPNTYALASLVDRAVKDMSQ